MGSSASLCVSLTVKCTISFGSLSSFLAACFFIWLGQSWGHLYVQMPREATVGVGVTARWASWTCIWLVFHSSSSPASLAQAVWCETAMPCPWQSLSLKGWKEHMTSLCARPRPRTLSVEAVELLHMDQSLMAPDPSVEPEREEEACPLLPLGCWGCRWQVHQGQKLFLMWVRTPEHFPNRETPADETEQDPVGILGTKAFLCPPFLDYRK